MKKIFKFLTFLSFVFTLLLSFGDNKNFSIRNKLESSNVADITLRTESSVNEGSSLYVEVIANNISFCCAEFSIYYDEDIFSFPEWNQPYSFVDLDSGRGESFIYNTDTNGVINFTYMFFDDKTFDNYTLLYFYLDVNCECIDEDTTTYLDFLIGTCIDSDINDIQVKTKGTYIDVLNIGNTYEPSTVNLWLEQYTYPIYVKEEAEFTVVFDGSTPFNCGEIKITYDPQIFTFSSLEYASLKDMPLKDYNVSRPGEILVSFVGLTNIDYYNALLVFHLTPIKDTGYDGTVISVEANNFRNTNFDNYENSVSFKTVYVEPNPNLTTSIGLTNAILENSTTYKTTLYLGEDTNLGAGDFIIYFDSSLLALKNYSIISDDDYMIGVNTNYVADGRINVSLLSIKGLKDFYNLINFEFELVGDYLYYDTYISVECSNVVDTSFSSIYLSTISCNLTHQHYGYDLIYEPSTCVTEGYRIFICNYCGTGIEEKLPLSDDHLTVETRYDEANEMVYIYCHDCNQTVESRTMVLNDFVQIWINVYLYMTSISLDDNGSGLCAGENGYYALAKTALIELENNHTGAMLALFNLEDKAPYERFCAWARANGEVFNAENGTFTIYNPSRYFLSSQSFDLSLSIILISVFWTLAVSYTMHTYLKRKKLSTKDRINH